MTQANPSPRNRLEAQLGFRMVALPLIFLLGLIAILGTTPALVGHQIGRIDTSSQWQSAAQGWLVGWLESWNRFYDSIEIAKVNKAVLPSALCMGFFLIMASAIRSIRVGTVRPVIATCFGLVVGLLLVPAGLWLWSAVAILSHLLRSFAGLCAHFLGHLPSTLRIVATCFLLITSALIVALWVAVLASMVAGSSPRTIFIGGVGLLIVVGVLYLLRPLRPGIEAVATWLAGVGLFVTVALVVVGIVVAAMGQAGRTAYLSVKASGLAGGSQAKCIDLSIGVGLTTSLVILGAVFDGTAGFGSALISAWINNPILSHLPVPVHFYREILPSSQAAALAPAFQGYNPFLDCLVLTLTAGIGTLTLIFSSSDWRRDGEAIIALPIMVSAGVAIAATLPLLFLWSWLRQHQN